MQSNPTSNGDISLSQNLLDLLSQMVFQLGRIANHFDPPPPDIVDTTYIANKLGCSTDWVAEMAREGEIPFSCVIPGTGDGKPWKFRRSRIDQWIVQR